MDFERLKVSVLESAQELLLQEAQYEMDEVKNVI
jgi:hypothetical protein